MIDKLPGIIGYSDNQLTTIAKVLAVEDDYVYIMAILQKLVQEAQDKVIDEFVRN